MKPYRKPELPPLSPEEQTERKELLSSQLEALRTALKLVPLPKDEDLERPLTLVDLRRHLNTHIKDQTVKLEGSFNDEGVKEAIRKEIQTLRDQDLILNSILAQGISLEDLIEHLEGEIKKLDA